MHRYSTSSSYCCFIIAADLDTVFDFGSDEGPVGRMTGSGVGRNRGHGNGAEQTLAHARCWPR